MGVASLWWALGTVAVSVASTATAAEGDRWYAGAAIGLYDTDYADGDLPHLTSSAYSAFIGYDLHRFLALEFALDLIETDADAGRGNDQTRYGALGFSPALVVKFPFPESDVEAFLRLGTSLHDYELESVNRSGLVKDKRWAPAWEVGLRGEHLFLEYLYHGEEQGLIMEQLRVGVRLRW
ncbi:MAG: outer membrane beta-barrel protein [Pseudomonadota bacterium]